MSAKFEIGKTYALKGTASNMQGAKYTSITAYTITNRSACYVSFKITDPYGACHTGRKMIKVDNELGEYIAHNTWKGNLYAMDEISGPEKAGFHHEETRDTALGEWLGLKDYWEQLANMANGGLAKLPNATPEQVTESIERGIKAQRDEICKQFCNCDYAPGKMRTMLEHFTLSGINAYLDMLINFHRPQNFSKDFAVDFLVAEYKKSWEKECAKRNAINAPASQPEQHAPVPEAFYDDDYYSDNGGDNSQPNQDIPAEHEPDTAPAQTTPEPQPQDSYNRWFDSHVCVMGYNASSFREALRKKIPEHLTDTTSEPQHEEITASAPTFTYNIARRFIIGKLYRTEHDCGYGATYKIKGISKMFITFESVVTHQLFKKKIRLGHDRNGTFSEYFEDGVKGSPYPPEKVYATALLDDFPPEPQPDTRPEPTTHETKPEPIVPEIVNDAPAIVPHSPLIDAFKFWLAQLLYAVSFILKHCPDIRQSIMLAYEEQRHEAWKHHKCNAPCCEGKAPFTHDQFIRGMLIHDAWYAYSYESGSFPVSIDNYLRIHYSKNQLRELAYFFGLHSYLGDKFNKRQKAKRGVYCSRPHDIAELIANLIADIAHVYVCTYIVKNPPALPEELQTTAPANIPPFNTSKGKHRKPTRFQLGMTYTINGCSDIPTGKVIAFIDHIQGKKTDRKIILEIPCGNESKFQEAWADVDKKTMPRSEHAQFSYSRVCSMYQCEIRADNPAEGSTPNTVSLITPQAVFSVGKSYFITFTDSKYTATITDRTDCTISFTCDEWLNHGRYDRKIITAPLFVDAVSKSEYFVISSITCYANDLIIQQHQPQPAQSPEHVPSMRLTSSTSKPKTTRKPPMTTSEDETLDHSFIECKNLHGVECTEAMRHNRQLVKAFIFPEPLTAALIKLSKQTLVFLVNDFGCRYLIKGKKKPELVSAFVKELFRRKQLQQSRTTSQPATQNHAPVNNAPKVEPRIDKKRQLFFSFEFQEEQTSSEKKVA